MVKLKSKAIGFVFCEPLGPADSDLPATTHPVVGCSSRKATLLVKAADKLRWLRKSKLFRGLTDTILEEIFEAGNLRQVGPKTNIIVSGEKSSHLFLLQSGRARSYLLTESGSEVVLLWVVPGGVLGLASLLVDAPSSPVHAMAVTDCEFLVWNRDAMRGLLEAYPELRENGFRLALHYLKRYMRRHVNIVTKSAESRLAQRLLELASEAGVVNSPGIAIDITNEQLSSLSDISPFTASRLLSRWEDENWLTKERGRVTLLAPDELEALVAA